MDAFRADRQDGERIDEQMEAWSQGDVASPGVMLWLADEHPLTPEAASVSGSGARSVAVEFDSVVVLTQTCDIRRSCWAEGGIGRPFVQVSPLVKLDDAELDIARGGFHPRYAAVPGAGEDAFADLDRCTTIEKAILARSNRVEGLHTLPDRQAFARALARQRGRFAFPDAVEATVSKLRSHLRDKRNRQGQHGDLVRAVDVIRARAHPEFSETTPFELVLVFVIDPTYLPPVDPEANGQSVEVREWLGTKPKTEEVISRLHQTIEPTERQDLWDEVVDRWAQKCLPTSPVFRVTAEAVSVMDYHLGRARQEPNLDLDHLTGEEGRVESGEIFDGDR